MPNFRQRKWLLIAMAIADNSTAYIDALASDAQLTTWIQK